jgi:hypothetical protein
MNRILGHVYKIVSRFALSCIFTFALLIASSRPAMGQVSVLTERYDSSRTGANLAEAQLNTANVNFNSFGKLWSWSVDGSVYGQPLYVPNVSIPNKGTHNIIYVVTMNDTVYAFDADNNTGPNAAPLWMDDFRNGNAVIPVPIIDLTGSNALNIVGNVGIESTPVIDAATQTMYLLARTKENGAYIQRLHALDISTGLEKLGGPVAITGSVTGSGNGSSANTLKFDPKIQNQRSALALVNGMVLIAWASHEDFNDYHGWIMAYDAQTLSQKAIYCTTPDGSKGGIWQAGRGPVIDGQGNVYYMVGNGDWNGTQDFSTSFLKFSSTNGLSLIDWFTPDNNAALSAADEDLGSSGPLLIPRTDLLVGGGKQSLFYLMHLGHLGGEQTGNGQIVQSFDNAGGEIKSGPVYWDRTVGGSPLLYEWADYDYVKSYLFTGTSFNSTPASRGSLRSTSGAALTLSANGTTSGTGLLWATLPVSQDGDHGTVAGVMRVLGATDLTHELWNSLQNPSRDDIGVWAKFNPPTVANGKVYVGSFSNTVSVFGLLSSAQDFNLLTSPSTATTKPGGSVTYTVNIGTVNGFSNNINLSVTGVPSNATASFSSSTVTGAGSSILTVTTSASTPLGSFPLLITSTSGSLSHSSSVNLNVSTITPGQGAISVNFLGRNATQMGGTELAGLIARVNWNNASGASNQSGLLLFDETGTTTGASVTWTADSLWSLNIVDQPGNNRLMKGYLDTGNLNPTNVSVTGLNSGTYNLYVYVDGDNGSATHSASYQLSGPGLATTSVTLTDPPNTDFSGTFTQANNSAGNYVLFTGVSISSGFTVTATPGQSSNAYPRAPVNGIQIVPTSQFVPDFTVSSTPTSQSVNPGASTTFSINVAASNGFNGAVSFGVTGLPAGASSSFAPTTVTGSGSTTLSVSVASNTTPNSYPMVITATGGSIFSTTNANLVVSGPAGPAQLAGSFFIQTTDQNLTNLGTADWAHWGSISSTSFDHKSTGKSQISNYTVLNAEAGAVGRSVGNGLSFSWTDGTPTANATQDRTNIYVVGLHAGFKISVPADTTPRLLTVYLGINHTQAKMQAHLSDNSAPDYVDTSLQNSFPVNGAYTFVYKAGSSGQTLTLTWTVEQVVAHNSGVSLFAATLAIVDPAADFTFSGGPPTQGVTPGDTAPFKFTIAPGPGFGGQISLSATGLPPGVSVASTPATVVASGTPTFAINTSAATPPGQYPLTITATAPNASHSVPVTLTVGDVTQPHLNAFSFTPTAGVNLTTQGTTDWAYWGLNSTTSFDHKAGVTQKISNFSVVTGQVGMVFGGFTPLFFNWTDGTPDTATTGTDNAVFIKGLGIGFQLTVPADTSTHTLNLYVETFNTQGKFTAHISDASSPDIVDTSLSSTGSNPGAYKISFRAGSVGQTLTLTFLFNDMTGPRCQEGGEHCAIGLQAATLQ